MCKCTPGIRTPYCGKPGCRWPHHTETPEERVEAMKGEVGTMNKPDLNKLVQAIGTPDDVPAGDGYASINITINFNVEVLEKSPSVALSHLQDELRRQFDRLMRNRKTGF